MSFTTALISIGIGGLSLTTLSLIISTLTDNEGINNLPKQTLFNIDDRTKPHLGYTNYQDFGNELNKRNF